MLILCWTQKRFVRIKKNENCQIMLLCREYYYYIHLRNLLADKNHQYNLNLDDPYRVMSYKLVSKVL
jgi:hypothetical protein